MRSHGIEVTELSPNPHLNEHVFTRDTAFVIDDQLFVASMNEEVRQGETEQLKEWLHEQSVPFQKGLEGSIEGGDVIIDGDTIWVGLSGRTTFDAVKDLQRRLPSYNVRPLRLKDDILHLDYVFNILSEDTALVYSVLLLKKI